MSLMSTYFCDYACALGQSMRREACLELELEYYKSPLFQEKFMRTLIAF